MTQTWSQLLYRMTPGLVNTERYYSDIQRAVFQKQRLSDLNTATNSPPSPLLIRYELNHCRDVEDGGRERLYETFGVVVDDLPRTRDLRLLLATETLLLHALEFLPATQTCLKTLALGVEFVESCTYNKALHTMPFNIVPFRHLVNNLEVLHLTLGLDMVIDLITAHEQWMNVTTFTLHVIIMSMDEQRFYHPSSIIPTVPWGPDPLSPPTLSQCRFPALNRFEISSHGSFHEHHFIGGAHDYLPQFIEWLGLRACMQLHTYVAYGQILMVPHHQSPWIVGKPRAWEMREYWLAIASLVVDDPNKITGLLGAREDQNWFVQHIK